MIYNLTRDFSEEKPDILLNAEQRGIDIIKEKDPNISIEDNKWFRTRLPYDQ